MIFVVIVRPCSSVVEVEEELLETIGESLVGLLEVIPPGPLLSKVE